ncbi:MAG: D-alanyl-D-alanine carboxypeptidase [Acidobacteriota bacterium]|nr:D-alanyl-D-alanine carboxypeptidase [Acidobacteriota bacterium]
MELAGRPRTGTSTSITAGYQPGEKGAGRPHPGAGHGGGGRPALPALASPGPAPDGGRARPVRTPAGGGHSPPRRPAPGAGPRHGSRSAPPDLPTPGRDRGGDEQVLEQFRRRDPAPPARGSPRGPPATTRAGLKVLEGCLDRWGIDRSRLILADGSGLAPVDRLTPRSLVAVLQRAERAADWGPELLTSLPRAAEDGTLRRRLASYRGRLRAKTGSLTGVSTLAGKLVLEDGRRLLFAILVQRKPPRPAPAALVDELLAAVEEALPAPGPENSQAVDDALPAPGDAHPAASRPAPGEPRRRVG